MPEQRARIPAWALYAGAGALAGLVSSLGYPPAHVWPLAGLALAGLFALELAEPPRRATLAGGGFFAVFSLVHNSWVALFGVPALVGLTIGMTGFGAAHGLMASTLARWAPRPLRGAGPPVSWVVVEAARQHIPFGGFPWGLSAHALAGSPLSHLAPFGGPLILGAVLAGGAATLAAAVIEDPRARSLRRPGHVPNGAGEQLAVLEAPALRPRPRPWPKRAMAAVSGPVAVAAIATAAAHLPTGTHTSGEARVALVQATDMNRDPTRAEVEARTILHNHLEETSRLPPGLDLVAWGESSLDADPRADPELAADLRQAAHGVGAPLMANGAVDVPGDPAHLYNTTFLYGPDGDLAGTYIKRHLVPFGEYVPARGLLRWVKELARVPQDFLPGGRPGVLSAGRLELGDLICFESADLGLSRQEISGGAQLLVVTTNNRSFSTSPLSSQHLEVDRVLAESTGRSVLHAAVSGSSAVILPDGDVVARAPLFQRRSLVTTVPLRSGRTLFVVLGDWVAWVALLGAAGLASPAVRKRRA